VSYFAPRRRRDGISAAPHRRAAPRPSSHPVDWSASSAPGGRDRNARGSGSFEL